MIHIVMQAFLYGVVFSVGTVVGTLVTLGLVWYFSHGVVSWLNMKLGIAEDEANAVYDKTATECNQLVYETQAKVIALYDQAAANLSDQRGDYTKSLN